MRPLLWKEMRDLRPWLLSGLALAGALQLLLLARVFDGVWAGNFVGMWMEALMPLAVAAVAIGIAARQIASERHARTLDFLLARPVPAGVIVWSKFLAGTVVLALLLAAAVALAWAEPAFLHDTGLRAIREQIGPWQLAAALFPRFWFLYALALAFSVLLDRSAKAAALAAVLALTVLALAGAFTELAPFSGFVFWLPYFDMSGGLVEAARSPRLSAVTGLVYAAGALLATAASATLLKRSPEPYLGNRGLALAAAAVIAVAVASAQAAAHRLPELAPVASWQLPSPADGDSAAAILANGSLVAVTQDQTVHFLDFRDPSRPRQSAQAQLPVWSTAADWSVDRAAIEGDTVFLVGQKKSLPVDDLEIAMLRPEGPIDAISLGPVRPGDYASAPVPVGRFVYVGFTRDRVSSLRVFDLASKHEVASPIIDRLLPEKPEVSEGQPPVRMLRRGTYLYIGSPSWLTSVDIANPSEPVVTSQLPVHPSVRFLYGFPRPMAWQDNRLFEIRIFPWTLASYDLSDPAHPAATAALTYHGSMTIEGSGPALYQPWRAGMLEYRAEGADLEARRYLRADDAVSALAHAGDYVYALTAADTHNRRSVYAFRVGR